MSKLFYEDKLNIYYEIKNGKTRKSLSIKYKMLGNGGVYPLTLVT